jgi:hypothetical protein
MDRWFPRIAIPLTWEQFRQLPQHPAFRYEYLDGRAQLTGRPRRYHALLPLADRPTRIRATASEIEFRPLDSDVWEQLPPLFDAAFAGTPPFSLLEPDQRFSAANDCVTRTRAGEFGLLIDSASFAAVTGGRILAAILITLLQAGDLESFDDPRWGEPPPRTHWNVGRPHVTWVLTARTLRRPGVRPPGSRAAAALAELGYGELASTFLLETSRALLWHWRNGFRLLSDGSPQRPAE